MKFTARREPGMALVLALVVLVLVGVLAATICFVGVQEARMGESMRHQQRAFGVAEEGVSAVIRTWDPTIYGIQQWIPFDSTPVPGGYPRVWAGAAHMTGAYGGHVYRLNGELYFIDVAGRDSLPTTPWLGGVRQRVGFLAHVRAPPSGVRAALTVGKGSRLSGQVKVDGNDHIPPGWASCGRSDSNQAGIRAVKGATLTTSGTPQILGSPPTAIDSAPRASAAALEGITHNQLAVWATHTLVGQTFTGGIGPVEVAGRCDESVVTNWGDGRGPNHLCGNYFPVVHLTGDATVSGLQGQGILLVDGSLVVSGGLEWYGVALIRGSLTVAGDPSRASALWGATLVQDSIVLQGPPGGSVEISYSKCAISKALETVALAGMLRTRGWVGLSDVP